MWLSFLPYKDILFIFDGCLLLVGVDEVYEFRAVIAGVGLLVDFKAYLRSDLAKRAESVCIYKVNAFFRQYDIGDATGISRKCETIFTVCCQETTGNLGIRS